MQNNVWKKILPHLLIVGICAVIALIFCYPALQGKELNQHDSLSWKAASHEAMEWYKKTGENPLWSNTSFGGMPTFLVYTGKTQNYVGYVSILLTSLLPKPANFLILAMLSFYLLMCVMRVNRWLGLLGAIAYAFSTYNPIIIGAGHETKMFALGFLPAALAGLILVFRGKYIGGGALFGISMALLVGTGHYQIVYYALIIFLLVGLGLFIRRVQEKKTKQGIIAGLLILVLGGIGAAVNAASVLPAQEFTSETMRGGKSELTFNHDKNKKSGGLDKDYAFEWSYGKSETFTILVPYLYGGASGEPADRLPRTNEMLNGQYDQLPSYWGPQHLGISGPVYFGAIICFLFVLGLLLVRSPIKWWLLAAAVIGILMAWGKYLPGLNYWLFDHLPMLNKFRTPSMILIIPQLIFPILGIWVVNDIINGKIDKKKVWKSTLIALGITAGLAFLVGVCASMFFDFAGPNDSELPAQLLSSIREDRAAMARNSGFRSVILILLSAGLIWLFVKDRIKTTMLIAGLGLLIAFDLIPVSFHYLGEDKYADADTQEQTFQPRPADQQIMQDPDPYYRVLDITRSTFQDAFQAYFHKCVGGYSPAKLEIYQDLIDVHMSRGFNTAVLNMLNTKYLIVPGGQNGAPAAMPNPAACGNAWFVDEVKVVRTADEEILAMKAPVLGDTAQAVAGGFDPRRTAVVRETFWKGTGATTFSKDSAATVKLAKYGLNDISFTSSNSKEGLAVFSDIWYPLGWKAYVDGKETPIVRADYVLRGLKIPAGQHTIEFKFRPKSYETGNTISGVTSILLLVLAAVGLYFGLKGKKEDEPDEQSGMA